MASETTLRWGILGCSRIARRGLIPGIRASLQGDLVALSSRDRYTAQQWATEFDVPHAHGTYEALLADTDVDAVYIPLPNELHKHWVFAAAEAGKHILCEKPLALDSHEAEAMVSHCQSRDVLLMEAFMWRHQPRTVALLSLVHGGEIGDLRLVRSSFSFPIDANDWRLDPSRGGGALWDVGCYGINTARLFAGTEPDSVRSFARFGPTGVDLSLTAELRFPNGVLGLVDCSFEQPFRCCYELVGTKGVFEVPDAYLPPEQPIAWRSHVAWTGSQDPRERLVFKGSNQYASMIDEFARSVDTGSLTGPAESGLAQMRVLDATLAAAQQT